MCPLNQKIKNTKQSPCSVPSSIYWECWTQWLILRTKWKEKVCIWGLKITQGYVKECWFSESQSSNPLISETVNKQTVHLSLVFFPSFFETESCSLYCPGWSVVAWSQLTATSTSWVQAILSTSASWVAGITSKHHHAWLIFVFFVEMGFYLVGQVGLKLLTSGDLPTSASQSAVITGLCYLPWPD